MLMIAPQTLAEKGHCKNKYSCVLTFNPQKIHVEEGMIWKAYSLSIVLRWPIEAGHKIKEYLGMKPKNQRRWCIESVGLESLRTFYVESIESLLDEWPF
jgi:hypothetical protein